MHQAIANLIEATRTAREGWPKVAVLYFVGVAKSFKSILQGHVVQSRQLSHDLTSCSIVPNSFFEDITNLITQLFECSTLQYSRSAVDDRELFDKLL